MKKEVAGILLAVVIFTAASCKTAKEAEGTSAQRGGQPSVTELIAQMDTNKDGKLSKEETKGPLLTDFSKIDSNSDGFLTKTEIEAAPKPSGQRQGGQLGPPPGRN